MDANVEPLSAADPHSPNGEAQQQTMTFSSDLVPQAFSHFTFAYSERPLSRFVGPDGTRGRCLVCDLQGSFDRRQNTFLLSDPVIHSELGRPHLFGATDMGQLGIDAFLRSHKCNDVCRLLKLPENSEFVRENVGQLETSSVNTVDVSVVKTNHLVERQGQRHIADLEIQKAKKHGDKFRSSNGAIRHELADVCYVTTKDFKVGVTGIRLENPLRAPPSARAAAPATTPVHVEVSIAPQWAAAAAGPSGGSPSASQSASQPASQSGPSGSSQDVAPRAAASGRGGPGGRGGAGRGGRVAQGAGRGAGSEGSCSGGGCSGGVCSGGGCSGGSWRRLATQECAGGVPSARPSLLGE